MTVLSPITSTVAMQLENKGSTYGKAQSWSSDYSFQGSQRDGGSNRPNRVEVLLGQTTIFSLYTGSIIQAYASEGRLSITRRGSEARAQV